MTREPENELAQELRDELRGLVRGPELPPALEARVVRALEDRGLLRAGRSRGARVLRQLALAAACVLIFAAGLLVGRYRPPATAKPAGEQFVLLLYRLDEAVESDPKQQAGLVREYSEWARRERAAGHVVAGEKLNDRAMELAGVSEPAISVASTESIGGYFVISAPDLDAAVAIARTCPHLQHGGRLVVRPIDRVP